MIAGVLCRHARVVELSRSAAALAEALFGGEDPPTDLWLSGPCRRAMVAPPPADEGGPPGAEGCRRHPPKAAGEPGTQQKSCLHYPNFCFSALRAECRPAEGLPKVCRKPTEGLPKAQAGQRYKSKIRGWDMRGGGAKGQNHRAAKGRSLRARGCDQNIGVLLLHHGRELSDHCA